MLYSRISTTNLVANFRKEAKELIKVHAKDVAMQYPDTETTQEQYKTEMVQHRIFFDNELTELFTRTLQQANHLSDLFKRKLEQELSTTYANYREYYKTRY